MAQDTPEYNGYCSLGVDQSLTGTGLCALYGDEVIRKKIKPGDLRGAERLYFIKKEILHFIESLDFRPQVLVMEGYALEAKNLPFALGELGGVIKVMAIEQGMRLYVVPPSCLKKFVVGRGNATKKDIQELYDVRDPDLADAQGLAEVGMRLLNHLFVASRAELEVVRGVQANPENNRVVGAGKSSPRRRASNKEQMTTL